MACRYKHSRYDAISDKATISPSHRVVFVHIHIRVCLCVADIRSVPSTPYIVYFVSTVKWVRSKIGVVLWLW